MTQAEAKNLVVAISSRALFDLDEAHCIYERDGLEALLGLSDRKRG
jgi:5'-nucleotidase